MGNLARRPSRVRFSAPHPGISGPSEPEADREEADEGEEVAMPGSSSAAWQNRVRRLVCEHPDVYRDFIAGKYTSVREAARAAGICPPGRLRSPAATGGRRRSR